MSKRYDYLIIGAGLFGSILAHELKKHGYTILVIEKRDHIAGNIYTKNEEGINVHFYGPHIFHTSNKVVWDYINQFAKFNNFVNRPKAFYKGKLYSLPINMMTFYQVAGCIKPEDAKRYLVSQCRPCSDPTNFEEWAISQIGKELYEILIHGYTKKQWHRNPRDLPAAIIKRLPIRFTFEDNYYNDLYQGIPIGGYTQIVEKLLDGIPVELGQDFESIKSHWNDYANRLIYTGPIDKFFDYCYGDLDYLSLKFESQSLEGDYQGTAVVNYTDEAVPYTRIIEHKHFEQQNTERTVITREYPIKWNKDEVPYYPINDSKNGAIYQKYHQLAGQTDAIFGGRLGSYKYLDMDTTIGQALNVCSKIIKK